MPLTLADFLQDHDVLASLNLPEGQKQRLVTILEDDFLAEFLENVITASEDILAIDPNLERRTILELAAAKIVKELKAEAASIRLLDARTLKMLSFGSSGLDEFRRASTVPVSKSIAGLVVRQGSSIIVPNISKDPLYQSKKIIATKGFNSLIAVPLRIPSFVSDTDDILGSLQIYYREEDRGFSKIEVILAEMFARRVSHVLARKKILDLKKLNDSKEKITDNIFIKLSKREGIKLKDFFNLIMPDIEEHLHFLCCLLFTISEDLKHIQLEAAYPLDKTYYEPGHSFTIEHHPAFWTVVHGLKEYADLPHERHHPNYLLVKNPGQSELTSSGLRAFIKEHDIHSILMVPLRIADQTRHILTFYAADQKQSFTEDEIELLTFLGKEIMKASTLEFLSDTLHDFKNPAIAVAGFAARAIKMAASCKMEEADIEKLRRYLEIISRESARMQDIALTISGEGRKEVVDLGRTAGERFILNNEVLARSQRKNVTIESFCEEGKLLVLCPLYSLERVLDNLLNNASKALPPDGGRLTMRCYQEAGMACVTVTNTGLIPADQFEQIRKGAVQGRGLNIITRFAQTNHGKLEIDKTDKDTVITIKLPLHRH
ncbi:MAG: GAF domain-containing protein [Proteobacteria bacterium]|nr:GAF domain-containing protein [Pseudomonadota bacterium]MBU1736681.1 GAF domain-containing protein [Pseudomonadota bacterium]